MSKIEELIQKLCPNGVEYREINSLCTVVSNRYKIPRSQYLEKGKYPIIDQGKDFISGFSNKEEVVLPLKEYVLFGDHTREVKYVSFPFVQGADGLKILESSKGVIPRYFYHCLKNLNIPNRGYNRHWSIVSPIEIPFPPVEIQEEIVRILDKFTSLSEKLNAELELRKKQYEYYRERLISSTKKYELIKLGELCKIQRGVRVVKKQLEESGEYPVYQNSLEPLGFYDKSNYPANTSFIICGGAAGSIGFSNVEFWAADDCFCFVSSDNLNDKYLFYVLKANQIYFDSRVRKAGVPRLSRNSIENFEMALPSLAEQERIVSILDKFDTLVNDQEKGLPAEIRKVQQQYEYYRDKLLTF